MLSIKYTPNIFLISVYVSSLLLQDMLSMCFEKLETIIFKETYSVFIEAGVRHLFLIPHSYIHDVPTKLPRENILDPQRYPGE